MDSSSILVDVKEFLAVVGLAVAGLALAAMVAFTPWYAHGDTGASVIEVHGPAAPASSTTQR